MRRRMNEAIKEVAAVYDIEEARQWIGRNMAIHYSIAGVSECRVGVIEGVEEGWETSLSLGKIRKPKDDGVVLIDPTRTITLGGTRAVPEREWKAGEPIPAGYAKHRVGGKTGQGNWWLCRLERHDGKEVGSIEPYRHRIPIARITSAVAHESQINTRKEALV